MAFRPNSKDKEPRETQIPSKVGTTSLKNRIKATTKTLFKNVVDQCNEIYKGDGWKLLQDVTVKTPIQPNTIQEVCLKFSQVMDFLR
jgi:hypothetical protein